MLLKAHLVASTLWHRYTEARDNGVAVMFVGVFTTIIMTLKSNLFTARK
jgi:hypothetical protein